MSLLLALVGVLIFGYSFAADYHLSTRWSEIVGTKADINRRPADVPYDSILMSFEHDWMVVRYFGAATFIIGVTCMFYERKRSKNPGKL